MPLQARPVPTVWLITDGRLGHALLPAARRLPPRSVIVVRAFALPAAGRASLIRALRRLARARRHRLIWAGEQAPQGFDGRLGLMRQRSDAWLVMPVHDVREAASARRHRADAVLISPVHPTRSHPGSATLGRQGFARLAGASGRPGIAMGGMDARRHAKLKRQGARGWAAIDAWLPRD